MHWVIVKTSIEFPNTVDPEILGVFANREHAIGELVKIYIKNNLTLLARSKLDQNVIDLRKKILVGDTNDIYHDNYKYSIVVGHVDKFSYFDDEIVGIYDSLKR